MLRSPNITISVAHCSIYKAGRYDTAVELLDQSIEAAYTGSQTFARMLDPMEDSLYRVSVHDMAKS